MVAPSRGDNGYRDKVVKANSLTDANLIIIFWGRKVGSLQVGIGGKKIYP